MESDAVQRDNDSSCNISSSGVNLDVTHRSAGMLGHVKYAAVYILRLPAASQTPSPGCSPAMLIKSELAKLSRLTPSQRQRRAYLDNTSYSPSQGACTVPKSKQSGVLAVYACSSWQTRARWR